MIIINLLINMINVFQVVFDERPKKIILSFDIEKEFVKELSNFIDYDKEYQTKAKFRGIDIEYRLSEDFISLTKEMKNDNI